jgi:hypothetical protein
MKLTGPACTEALSGAEEAGRRERAEGNAGGVRVERKVRPYADRWMNRAQEAGTLGGCGREGHNAGSNGPSATTLERAEQPVKPGLTRAKRVTE